MKKLLGSTLIFLVLVLSAACASSSGSSSKPSSPVSDSGETWATQRATKR
jgi:ABC-type Fe3+-citrate transport system substrate-binding protein